MERYGVRIGWGTGWLEKEVRRKWSYCSVRVYFLVGRLLPSAPNHVCIPVLYLGWEKRDKVG